LLGETKVDPSTMVDRGGPEVIDADGEVVEAVMFGLGVGQ
jgi:hypothetical protein